MNLVQNRVKREIQKQQEGTKICLFFHKSFIFPPSGCLQSPFLSRPEVKCDCDATMILKAMYRIVPYRTK